jgi:hypothetical protein
VGLQIVQTVKGPLRLALTTPKRSDLGLHPASGTHPSNADSGRQNNLLTSMDISNLTSRHRATAKTRMSASLYWQTLKIANKVKRFADKISLRKQRLDFILATGPVWPPRWVGCQRFTRFRYPRASCTRPHKIIAKLTGREGTCNEFTGHF